MKKWMKAVIAIVIIIPIVGFISLVVLLCINNKKATERDEEAINNNYNSLIDNIVFYNDIRAKYAEGMNDFYLDTFIKKRESYEETLTEYNKIIWKIDSNANNLKSKCNHLYKNGSINKICNSYGKTYEKLVNLYVSDINNYNTKIAEYNSYKKASIPMFNTVHQEYIDYDGDGVYEGSDSNGESEK